MSERDQMKHHEQKEKIETLKKKISKMQRFMDQSRKRDRLDLQKLRKRYREEMEEEQMQSPYLQIQ